MPNPILHTYLELGVAVKSFPYILYTGRTKINTISFYYVAFLNLVLFSESNLKLEIEFRLLLLFSIIILDRRSRSPPPHHHTTTAAAPPHHRSPPHRLYVMYRIVFLFIIYFIIYSFCNMY